MRPSRSSSIYAESTPQSFPFALQNVWGEDAERIVDHIVLAEFDIDTGSTVRHQYPSPVVGYENDYFASYMLPEGAHNREQDWTIMFLNRNKWEIDNPSWTGLSMELTHEEEPENRFLYGLNLVRTKHDKTVRRGAVVKALAIFSRYHFIDIFRAPLIMALDKYYESQTVEVLEELYNSINNLNIFGLPRPTWVERALMRRGVTYISTGNPPVEHTPTRWNWGSSFSLFNTRIPVSIPLHKSPDEVGEGISLLVRTFGESIMKIYNAVLTGQRVLFVGYNHAAGDVCNFVLATVSLVSSALHGVLKRCYPYANLTDLSFLETDGYISGVTNPMFEQHDEWWDLLCVLDLPNSTGAVFTSDEKKAEKDRQAGRQVERKVEERNYDSLDSKFSAKLLSGIDLKLGDEWVKSMFSIYTQYIVDQALDQNMLLMSARLKDDHRKTMTLNSARVILLTRTKEFGMLSVDPWRGLHNLAEATEGVDGFTLRSHVRRLQMEECIPPRDVINIYNDLCLSITTEAEMQVLLILLPEGAGVGAGISALAAGMFHTHLAVRKSTVTLLRRMSSFESTRMALEGMNHYMTLAFSRISRELDDGTQDRIAEISRVSTPNSSPRLPSVRSADARLSLSALQVVDISESEPATHFTASDNPLYSTAEGLVTSGGQSAAGHEQSEASTSTSDVSATASRSRPAPKPSVRPPPVPPPRPPLETFVRVPNPVVPQRSDSSESGGASDPSAIGKNDFSQG